MQCTASCVHGNSCIGTCRSKERRCTNGACQELLASMATLYHAECHHHNGAANQLCGTCATMRPASNGQFGKLFTGMHDVC